MLDQLRIAQKISKMLEILTYFPHLLAIQFLFY